MEKLLIQTEAIHQSLVKEVAKLFFKKKSDPKIKTSKQSTKAFNTQQIKQSPLRNYEPSNICSAYDGNIWRFRRMYDWFNQLTLDDRQDAYFKNILKPLD